MAEDMAKMMAEYLARGGKVTKLGAGERAISRASADKEFYKAQRTGEIVLTDKALAEKEATEYEAAMERYAERRRDAFMAAKMDGWGTDEALEYANTASFY